MILVSNEQHSINDIIKSFLLLPINPHEPGPFYGYSVLGVAWTLSYEIFFYLTFLVSMSINYKYRSLISSAIIISFIFIGNYYIFGKVSLSPHTPSVEGSGLHYYFIFTTNPILINFVLGMIAEFIYSNTKTNVKFINQSVRGLAPIVAVISLSCLMTPGSSLGDMQWAIPCFGIILSLSLLEKSGINFDFKNLVALGTISYSIYLIHIIVIITLQFNFFSFLYPSGFSRLIMVILLSIFTAKILYNYIEKPSQILARKLIKK